MDRTAKEMNLQTSMPSKSRNPAIEYCRLVASVLVVFIHFGFPAMLGEIVDCLARIAVPFFFVVSGYFAYGADESVIKKRMVGILKLNVYATLLYLGWGGLKERFLYDRSLTAWLLEKVSPASLSQWLIFGKNPFSPHLWYLTAIAVVYAFLYLYVKWNGRTNAYGPLYIAGFVLYAINFMTNSLLVAIGSEVSSMFYRNALFFGLPMFVLGIFLREYRDKILDTYRLSTQKLLLIFAAGVVLSVIQLMGFGMTEMPLGALFEVMALMLLLSSVSANTCGNKMRSLSARLGELSTYVYVTHYFWRDVYKLRIEQYVRPLGDDVRAYLFPVMVVVISVCTGVMWIAVKGVICREFRKFSI